MRIAVLALPSDPCILDCPPGSDDGGEPYSTVWIWAGPSTFEAPGGAGTPFEYGYVVWFEGRAPGTVATESRNWSEVEAIFR